MNVKGSQLTSKLLAFMLTIALVFTMMPLSSGTVHATKEGLQLQTPVLVATGKALVGEYKSVDDVSKEKSWTLEELKALDGVSGEMYSAKQQQSPYTKSYNIVNGVKVSSLIGDLNKYNYVKFVSSDKYDVSFKSNEQSYDYDNPGVTNVAGLASGRYFYDGFKEETKKEVPVVISWAYNKTTGSSGEPPTSKPEAPTADNDYLRLFCGQLAAGHGPEDMNGQLFNGKDKNKTLNKVVAGEDISEAVLTVGSKTYTRADILLMQFAEKTYQYDTKNGNKIDKVRGVPLSVLLSGEDEDAVVSFETVDNYDMSKATKTVKQLNDGNYMLAYEVGGKAVCNVSESKYGYLTLYGDGDKPSKMVNKIKVTTASGIDFSNSPYKHITNGGQEGNSPYNIDSITGATLTIEGPGMTTSTPLSVRDLETKNAGCFRGVYEDTRGGETVSRTYEGIDLYYMLNDMAPDSIKMTKSAYQVTLKNRNRKNIATLTLDELKEMHDAGKPAIVAYGTANSDGTNERPFVFNGAAGEDKNLGNGDGCLKLVYDLNTYGDQGGKYTKFANMAYIYVEEKETFGFKHDKAPYNTAENSQYVLTVTGDEIGREINYTVEQLEKLVKYDENGNVVDNGYGHRDDYSLANSSYWYVNSYEGVKLWELLLHSGLDKSKATDKNTKVTFKVTDNYTGFDTFTLEEVANPDKFGFYEKNAADSNDGTYKGNENIRQGDDVSTGDKIKTGYPILVAYGVNSYPYVISKDLDGYLSGLSNDGGPLRIISGKREYGHANGSNQAKLLDKIIVGENTYNYSTHSYQPEGSVYKKLENSELKIKVINGDKNSEKTYTVKDIEDLIYGGKLSTAQLTEAKVKGFYEVGKKGTLYNDLYEGVNLNYFLKDVVKLTGSQGSITFKNGENSTLTMNLDDVLSVKDGYNGQTKLSGLSPVIAYAKNGYPLVASNNVDGYIKNQTLPAIAEGEADSSYDVKNNGGPLHIIFPRANKNAESTLGNMTNVTEIEINLEADKYAHVESPYDVYATDTLTVSGEGTRLLSQKQFTVEELEGNQSLATTAVYSFKNKSGTVSQQRYRGLNLYKFLKSTNVGLKNNADKVLVYADGLTTPVEFSLSDITSTYINTATNEEGLPVMLAYGSAASDNSDEKDGKPLVKSNNNDGYAAAYGNDGGPLKLIIGQKDADDINKSKCVKNVTAIEVTASEQTSWNHSSSEIFKSYLDDEVRFSVVDTGDNNIKNITYTVKELEDMTELISQEEIYSTSSNTWEGLNFWQLIQKTFSEVEGIDNPITITVTAKDGFNVDVVQKVKLDGLKNGVKDGNEYVPVMLCYAVDGYPLASGGKNSATGEGYDSTIDNKGGPMRLMVQKAQGACIMEVVDVKVKVGKSAGVNTTGGFIVESNNLKSPVSFTVDKLQKMDAVEKEYSIKGGKEKVRGVMLSDILTAAGIKEEKSTFDIQAAGYNGAGTYFGIKLTDAENEEYIVAYEVFNAETQKWETFEDVNKDDSSIKSDVRIYRNYLENHPEADQSKWYNKCTGITGVKVTEPTVFDTFESAAEVGKLPVAGIRATAMDKDGNLWVGTYGGGASKKAANEDAFVTYNTKSEPPLESDTVSAICPDNEGGVWMSQNASYMDQSKNRGVAYMKDGKVTYFRASDNPRTIPNDYVQEIKIDNNGNVWFGSFGGLTKYDPKAGSWQTWDSKDGFPAMSIDNIEFDQNGGIWCGFYPESSKDDGSEAFTGGFAYFKDGKVVKSYKYASPKDSSTEQFRLGDVWVRDIAVDKNGGAWIVASGSYEDMADNKGGRLWYISKPGASPVEYSGYDLFGKDAFTKDSELRMVTADSKGGLWFGTSKDGVFYVSNGKLANGKLEMTAEYSSKTGSWPNNFDNVYSLDIYGDTLYVGTSNGLATHKFDIGSVDINPPTNAGDATEDTAQLTVTGSALVKNGYFTIRGLKNNENITKVSTTFKWLNSTGATGTSDVEGATLENIIFDAVGIKEGVEISSIDVISSDNKTFTYTPEQILNEDLDGNKAMYAWSEGGEKVNKIIIGQFNTDDNNKSLWAKNVDKIVVNKKYVGETVKPAGDSNETDASLKVTGNALAKDGYFTIKGLKNAEGIVKKDVTFNWLNSKGQRGSSEISGATLENIICDAVGLDDGVEVTDIQEVKVIATDGKFNSFKPEQIFNNDISGNKAMYAWSEDNEKVNKVVIGQFDDNEVNKSSWIKDVNEIQVICKPVGSSTADSASLIITGNALKREGFFESNEIESEAKESVIDESKTIDWVDSKTGEEGRAEVEGATVESLIYELMGVARGVEIESIDVITSDGSTKQFAPTEIFGVGAIYAWKIKNVEKPVVQLLKTMSPILLLKENISSDDTSTIIIGNDRNDWIEDVVKIVVNKKINAAPENPEGPDNPDKPNEPVNPGDSDKPNEPANPDDSDKPNEPVNPDDTDKPEANDIDANDKDNNDNAVKSGDESNMIPFMVLLITALIGAAGTVLYRRRSN